MPTVTCVALAAALLQAVAGLGKLWHPGGFVLGSAEAGRAMPATVVRGIALGETVVAGWALVVGGAVAWGLVAASYVGFTVFAALVRQRSGGAGACGCFGREEAPVS